MLCGIPKAPSNYSPFINLEAAKERQNLILNTLVKNGVISEKEKEDAYNEELVFSGTQEKK